MQLRALKRAGCKRIHQEKGSSVGKRPELVKVLASLRPGQVLIVYKLDRVARSLKDLLGILERLEQRGCGIRSISEPVDTATPAGRLMIQVLGAVAEFERSLIRERCVAGQVAARARGQTWGRVRKFTTAESAVIATLWREGWGSQKQRAAMFDVSSACLRDAIHKAELRGRWQVSHT